ncbi:hypothetical protein D3C83_137080 [compost metagenome]
MVRTERREAIAGHRMAGAAAFDLGPAEPDAGRDRRPAELGLPPMVDHRQAEPGFRPVYRVRVGALAGEEEGA